MWIFLIIIIALLTAYVWIRNLIVRNENACKRAWSEVANFELQKVKILDELKPLIDRYTNFEQGTLTQISALRQNILSLQPEQQNVKQLEQVESLSSELFKGIQLQVEAYPELKADEIYQTVMAEISEQNQNVGASITIFNRNVEQFNNSIQVFPNNLVNSIGINKKALRPFRDPVTSKAFSYKPNFQ